MSRSIQQTATNSASTQVTEVGTNTGFNAGDLVYYNNGDYKGASSLTLPSSANFAATALQPTTPQSMAYCFNQAGAGVGVYGGSPNRGAAVLTNGNVVQAYMSPNNGQPYFQIVNTSGVIQVAATVVSATYTNGSYGNIGVLSLTGGGFVVYWINSTGGTTNALNYAIYTNSGSVTLAATQDTSFSLGGSYGTINGIGLANGTFVLCATNISTNYISFRGYSAAGVGAYSTVTIGTYMYSISYNWIGLTARSDSSFLFFFPIASNGYYYALYASNGTGITTGSFTVTNAAGQQCDATVLSDGTTIVLAYSGYNSSKYTNCFRFLPTGNTLGSENVIPGANENGNQASGSVTNCSVLGLSNGNFIYAFADASNSYGLCYAVLNSSGACVTGTNSAGTIPLPLTSVPMQSYVYPAMIETSAAINLHWSMLGRASGTQYNTYYVQLSKTTYLPLGLNTASNTVGTTSASASGIGYANTAPTSISTAAAATGTYTVPTSPSYTLQPTLLYSASVVCGTSSATFPDGKFVIAYRDTSANYAIYASVFSATGALITTISVSSSSYVSSYSGGVSVCTLPSGKFVVSYQSIYGTITNVMYSSSYSVLYTTTRTGAYATDDNHNMSSAGLSNDRWVLVYTDGSNYATYAVYDNTNTLIAGPTTLQANNCYGMAVAATSYGSFFVNCYNTGGGPVMNMFHVGNSTGNSYANIGSTSYGSSGSVKGGKNIAWSNGVCYNYYYSGTYNPYWVVDGVNDYATGASTTGGADAITYANVALGCTGLGNPVLFRPTLSTPAYPIYAWPNKSPSWTSAFTFPNSGAFAASGMSFRGNTGFGTLPTLTSGVGNNIVAAWCDTNGYLNYAIINITPVSSTVTLTAGTSSSVGIPVSPTATTSATVIGATFVGVAAATVAAGSAGPVITNGPAKLNSNYTNTASGAFDHSGTPTGGVRGTYNGKVVNMQGNS